MEELENTRIGEYLLKRKLARGGMSQVYLAWDERSQREVAIKIVSKENSEHAGRFQQEIKALSRLSHEHILPVLDSGEEGQWLYMVTPYIEDGTLRDLLHAKGRLAPEEAGKILVQVCEALQFAHNAGVLHRDIKASNILLYRGEHVYLSDFGLVKGIEESGELTRTGCLIGTPEYMAPELAEQPASKSSDIYALGILLYQMVTGRVPFCAETPVATFWKHLRERPMPPSHLNPAIPRSVDLVILHALEKDPRRRFHSPLALAHAYRRALRSSQTAHDDAWESGEAQESSFAFNFPESAAPLPVLDPPARVGQGEQRKQQEEILVLPALPTLSAPSTDSLEQAESLQEDDGSNPAYPVTTSATIPMEGMGEQRTSPVDTPFAASDLTGLASTHSLQPPATRQRSRPPRPTTMRRRHRKRNPVIVAATVGVGFLLLVALLMSFVYVTAVSRQEAVATATVQEMTTAAAQSARATAEAHAQATATASVLTNVTATTPILSDALLGNTAGRWPENDNCRFMKGPPDTPTIHLGVRRPHEGVERS